MTRGTALVLTVARVTQLTGVQKLANLEVGSGITLTDLLVTASDAIYDQLERDGESPDEITNQTVFEKAVAWHFLALLVIGNYLPLPEGLEPPKAPEGQADPYAWSDVYLRRVRATYPAGTDAGPAAGEQFGSVKNYTSLPLYPDFE